MVYYQVHTGRDTRDFLAGVWAGIAGAKPSSHGGLVLHRVLFARGDWSGSRQLIVGLAV